MAGPRREAVIPLYVAIGLISAATLALEVALVRLLSVLTWYDLAFFAISTAMLGMTAGAVTVYLRQRELVARGLERSVAFACCAFAVVTPVSLIVLDLLPLGFEKAGVTAMSVSALALATVLCSLPFYCSGVAVSALLTLAAAPIGRLYAVDLLGAAAGCLLVLLGLSLVDTPSLILFSASVGGLAAYALLSGGARAMRRAYLAVSVTIGILAALNSITVNGIRPAVVKESVVDPAATLLDRWNSLSQVVVRKLSVEEPQYWGPSPKAPRDPIAQFWMLIDGAAGTTVRAYQSRSDVEHLRYDITNVVY